MLQEVFIAQMLTVMCGHKLVDFSILYFGFLNLYITHYHLFRELFRPVESKDQETKIEYIRKHGAWKMLDLCACWFTYNEGREYKFSTLLNWCRGRQTTRARDLFFFRSASSCTSPRQFRIRT